MASVTTIQFLLRLSGACSLGGIVGFERQWHRRLAGPGTNALVAAGASAFVMAGSAISGDPSAFSRMASFVVSGVGFLGAGVIFKDGVSVHGLNTAATIWCAAAIGVLAGLDALNLALIMTAIVLVANIVLKPLLNVLHLGIPANETSEARYEIVITCRSANEMHLRALLLTAIGRTTATLQAIHSDEMPEADSARLRTEIITLGRRNEMIEEIAVRLSIEPSVTSLSWSAASTVIE